MNHYGGIESQGDDAQTYNVYNDTPATPAEVDTRAADKSRSRFVRTAGLTVGASAAMAALYVGLHPGTSSARYDTSLGAVPSANVAQHHSDSSPSVSGATPSPMPTASVDDSLSFTAYNEYTLETPITAYIWGNIVEPYRETTFEAQMNATTDVSAATCTCTWAPFICVMPRAARTHHTPL